MPIERREDGWYWGSQGPFPTKAKALEVQKAAYASGHKPEHMEKEEKA